VKKKKTTRRVRGERVASKVGVDRTKTLLSRLVGLKADTLAKHQYRAGVAKTGIRRKYGGKKAGGKGRIEVGGMEFRRLKIRRKISYWRVANQRLSAKSS